MSMKITVNADETVTLCGADGSTLDGVLSGGLDTQVNALSMEELLAVRLSVVRVPYPGGAGERVYRDHLKVVQGNPDKLPSCSLVSMRKAILSTAIGGCNAPSDSYLQIAYDIKRGAEFVHKY